MFTLIFPKKKKKIVEVTCGDPGSISNGNIDRNQFTYGDTIQYNCNTDFMLIDGSLTRTCQLNGLWNGTKPSCACKLYLINTLSPSIPMVVFGKTG